MRADVEQAILSISNSIVKIHDDIRELVKYAAAAPQAMRLIRAHVSTCAACGNDYVTNDAGPAGRCEQCALL